MKKLLFPLVAVLIGCGTGGQEEDLNTPAPTQSSADGGNATGSNGGSGGDANSSSGGNADAGGIGTITQPMCEEIVCPEGPAGPRGERGERGERGPEGAAGPQGERGERGYNGDSCSVMQGSGSATVSCTNGTQATIRDGVSGSTGPRGPAGSAGVRGPAGADGSSCTVVQVGDSAVINCTDGTRAVVRDGTDGADGPQGLRGPRGLPGLAGPAIDKSKLYEVVDEVALTNGAMFATVACLQTGDILITGGCEIVNGGPPPGFTPGAILTSKPVDSAAPTGASWECRAWSNVTGGALRAHAVCLVP